MTILNATHPAPEFSNGKFLPNDKCPETTIANFTE